MDRSRRWWALAAVSLATFMTYLDNNIVNVALPTIQRALGLSLSGLEWIVSGYILVFAGLMLAGGRLADVYGRRRVFLTGLAVFTLASLAAGLADSSTVLIASRALQGVGAALLTPAALAILPATFPDPRERGLAVGIWSAVGALALALGPVTGGVISQQWHWGWIYLINVPVGLVTLGLGAFAIGRQRHLVARRLDVAGLTSSSVSLLALTYGLIEGQRHGWTSGLIMGSFVLAAAAAVTFVAVESRAAHPMIDLSLFRSRLFSGGVTAMGLWAFGVFGIYFFTALYLQNVLGFSPTRAGAAFVPMALVMAVVAAASGPVAARIGTHRAVAGGLGLMALAVLGVSSVGGDGSLADLMPWFLAYGTGAGLLVPLTATILGLLPAEREGVASGVLNVSREVFGLLGVTVLGAILSTRQASRLAEGAGPLPAFLSAYQFALVIAAAVVAVGVPVSLYALRHRAVPRPLAAEPVLDPVG
jgi:EmrB/QacA subfamily drug resistance transporter